MPIMDSRGLQLRSEDTRHHTFVLNERASTVLEGLEKSAREAKEGLWADPQPVPPWEWRMK
jgi:endonuclease YncB( thermonuclease family)